MTDKKQRVVFGDDLNTTQLNALMAAINPDRVSDREGAGGRTLAYVEAWDIKMTLSRIFGVGNWSWDIVDQKPLNQAANKWFVKGILHIHQTGARYSGAAVGSASGADAEDNALKGADSDALKRAASNLGPQFGLGLYNKGSRTEALGFNAAAYEAGLTDVEGNEVK
jgi:recombination DNA repair RAD52 pathway protein